MNKTYLKSISFSGIKSFEKNVKINFVADKSVTNRSGLLKEFMTDYDGTILLNSAVGIIGPNSSGKTTIGDAFYIYSSYVLLGKMFFESLNSKGNINFGNSNRYLVEDFFNVNSNKIEIEMEICSSKFEIKHKLQVFIDGKFDESISVRKKTNFRSSKINFYEKDSNFDIDLKTFIDFTKLKKHSTNTTKTSLAREEAIEIFDIIEKFASDIHMRNANSLGSLPKLVYKFLTNNSISLELAERKEMFKNIVMSLDAGVSDVIVNNLSNRHSNFEIQIELNNARLVSLNAISTGTYKVITTIMELVLISYLKPSGQKYYFFDEIDNSWHPNLTRLFISMFTHGPLYDWTLICTFHNPYISHQFRKDALYLISENKDLQNWNKYVLNHNKKYPLNKLRYDNDFISKYLDEVICSGPEKINFDIVAGQFYSD